MPLRWEKELSRSDAQVRTQGWPVPYIRLTRSGHAMDTQTWFRNVFFAGATWVPSYFGDHAVEETMITFNVRMPGQNPQNRILMITHNDGRQQTGRSTPNTWVHWDDATRNELRANNYTGRRIVLERSQAGVFSLSII